MYIQLAQPNLSIQGRAGWCLEMQENVWSTPHWYANAHDAWESSPECNHPGEFPPDNVAVLVYWSFYYIKSETEEGHVATSVPGQGIFSSPFDTLVGNQWFLSVQAVTDRINKIKGANSTYLGWSEILAGVKVVTNKENDMPNDGDVDNVYLLLDGRPATDDEKKVYTGKDWSAADGIYYGKVDPAVKELKQNLANAQTAEYVAAGQLFVKKG